MSIEAIRYVKNLEKSPIGEQVEIREKAVLWYLAYCHRGHGGDATVAELALANNIARRTVREILQSCVAKGLLRREGRFAENGSRLSNRWHFAGIEAREEQG